MEVGGAALGAGFGAALAPAAAPEEEVGAP